MTILTVGQTSDYASIAAAMLAASSGDEILLEAGYGDERAWIDKAGVSVRGDSTSTGIVLSLAPGIPTFTLTGTAPITVLDAIGGSAIVANAGNNFIWVRDSADAVSGGLGDDRLVVDYRLATGAVIDDSLSEVREAGGSRLVTITAGTFEHFTIRTGSGVDTLTTYGGDDSIDAGDGANTVTVGQGRNFVRGGSGADTVTGLDRGNTVHAGNGANTITIGGGADIITTGIGTDTIVTSWGEFNRWTQHPISGGFEDDRMTGI